MSKPKRTQLAIVVLLSTTLGIMIHLSSNAQQPGIPNAVPQQDSGVLMRAKLGSSQKIVEGLTAGDFQMIEKGAADLVRICDSQNWRRHEDTVSTNYRAELARAARRLKTHAQTRNLEGAAYVYMHTLTTCINCHEHSRNVLKIADQVPNNNKVIPIPVTDREAHAYRRREMIR